jgi:hypothetical protein
MFDSELDVFFDEDDFAVACTRSRPGEDDVQFSGILATGDEDLFEGRATVGTHVLQYATASADLAEGDVLRTVATDEAGESQPDEVWRVLRTPERVVDGAESRVFLKPAPDA